MSRRKSKQRNTAAAPIALRNPVATNPLLGKSSTHGKTRKADRRANKITLRKMPLERNAYPQLVCEQAFGSSGIFAVAVAHNVVAANEPRFTLAA